jgi:beta-lactamase class A
MRLIGVVGITMLLGASQPAVPARDLAAELQRISARAPGTLGVAVIDVASGRTVSVRGREWFPMMSVYKLPIAIHALRVAQQGTLDLEQRVTLRSEDRRPGLSPLSRAIEERGPQTHSLRELLSSMIRISDNAASDTLLRLAGGPPAVMATLRALKIDGIHVDRFELDFAADYYGVCCVQRERPFSLDRFAAAVARVPDAQRRRAAAAYLRDRRDSAQPEAMALLLARLVRGELLDAADTAWLIAEMSEMHTRDTRLRAGLPPGTLAALRPGTSGQTAGIRAAHNDNAIVRLPDGRYLVIAAFLKGARGTEEQRDATLAAVARAAYGAIADRKSGPRD